MSIDIMNRLWWREDLSTTEKFVAIVLANAAGEEGLCWPAVDTIALVCRCSPRTVQNALRKLESDGFIKRHERKDRSSIYAFQLEKLPHIKRDWRPKEKSPAADLMTGAADSPVEKGTGESVSATGESASDDGCSRFTQNRNSEPSRESSEGFMSSKDDDVNLERDLLGHPIEVESPAARNARFLDHVLVGWNEMAGRYRLVAGIEAIDDVRRKLILDRAEELRKRGVDEFAAFDRLIERVHASGFLTGRTARKPEHRNWKFSLPFAFKKDKFLPILEGSYDDEIDRDGAARLQQLGDTAHIRAARGVVDRIRRRQEQPTA